MNIRKIRQKSNHIFSWETKKEQFIQQEARFTQIGIRDECST